MVACVEVVSEPAALRHAPLPIPANPKHPAATRTLAVGVIGPGRVGTALLGQVRAAQARLARGGLSLLLRGVACSRRMWLDCDDPELNARQDGAQTWRPTDLDEFAAHVVGEDRRPAVLVDCTASEDVANDYAGWLAAGIHVVTPSKLAGSGPLRRWDAIHATPADGGRFRHEAAVCAGLPVVQTLRDLVDTGDELFEIEGMFSGTLAWLCNHHDGRRPFSALLREAHTRGYTEPDPRADLTGLDVARKLVILAREAGIPLSVENVEVESLVPPELMAAPVEDFMQHVEALDAPLAAQLERAQATGGVLRHVGSLDRAGRASVRLAVLPPDHPFAHTRLTDNVVQFRTRRYAENPMVVQGPGAGPEVTAAGVFGDVLRIADAVVPVR